MKNLKIYFTSDMHGYLFPFDDATKKPKAQGLLALREQFKKDENTLIIDAGDTLQGSPLANYLSSHQEEVNPIAKIMNEIGYDYVTLGNHDFNYGKAYLENFLTSLDAKCVCCNVVDEDNKLPILPYTYHTLANGLRIAIVGVVTDYINRWERAEHIVNTKISDAYDCVSATLKQLDQPYDLLIGVYHGGIEVDLNTEELVGFTKENIAYKLCNDFNFDLLLTGHQHMPVSGQYFKGTYVVQPTHNASVYLEINVEVDGDTKNITSSLNKPNDYLTLPVDENLLAIDKEVQAWMDTPIGNLSEPLIAKEHLTMALEGAPLANFINNIQLAVSNADISCTSFANVIAGFNQKVSIRDVLATYPYPNTLVVKEVTGTILKEALERCASYFAVENGEVKISKTFLQPKIEHYNYDYFANMNYTFDLTKPVGERVVEMSFKGQTITPEQTLKLAMNNYRASGTGGYDCYTTAPNVFEDLTETPELITNYFLQHPEVKIDTTKYLTIIK